jgi:TRAP transporter TAXI family solute receptor
VVKTTSEKSKEENLMRRVIYLLIAVVMVAGLITSGCAQTPKGAQEFELHAMRAGTTTYALSFALAEIVNQKSTWLRLTAVESAGSIANLRTVAENPEKRENTVFFTHEASNYQARTAMEPFTSEYKGARAMAAFTQGAMWFWTKDKSISSPKDLAGKRIMLGSRGANTAVVYEWLLKRWGVWDTVEVSYGAPGAQVDALTDGLVDAIGTPFGASSSPGGEPPFKLSGLSIKLFSSRPNIGWIVISPEDIQAMVSATGYPSVTTTMPAGVLDKFGVMQGGPMPVWGNTMAWWADVEVDEDVVYELVKTMYENTSMFAELAGPPGESVTQQTMARVAVEDDLFHPGALKFYKEMKLMIGY